ncbi:MAG: flavin reductase family protein [candidate division Zixibacteria bacterium]|nr:flavin reductase family protein [candidate division Zixibacteria bacterium]
MSKVLINPTTMLMPAPAALVSCGEYKINPNIITVAWIGVACSEPPMIAVGIRENLYSFGLIKQSGEFVVNITGADIVREVDYCGVNSGKDVDKFKMTGLTPMEASKVKPPLIKECPINLECQVRRTLELGSHHLFIGEVVATHIDEDKLDGDKRPDVAKIQPIVYCPGARQYWTGLQAVSGAYGFSKVKK